MSERRIALVTGCSREMGLGVETCRQLVARGYTVIPTARDRTAAEAAAGWLAPAGSADAARVHTCPLDVSSEESVRDAAAWVGERFGSLHALVNNAGGMYDAGGKALETQADEARQGLEMNLLSAWRTIQSFAPLLVRGGATPSGACVVNVSSAAASFGGDGCSSIRDNPQHVPVYAVSKAALNALTIKLAEELAPQNVRVNAVCPGFCATYPGLAELGARPVSEGAAGIVWAATLRHDGPTGGFFRDGKPLAW